MKRKHNKSRKMVVRRPWSPAENTRLRQLYPNRPTCEIAALMGRAIGMVYQHAAALNLKKSAEYLASPAACRLRRGDNIGAAFRFSKGQRPWNDGLKGVYKPGGRAPQTQFKKGNRPHTWRPIGTLRYSKDGYLQRKISDTGYPPHDWVGVHILLWNETHGPVPRGHVVSVKDGNKTNIVIGNLELISRAELMRRNSVHRLPKEIALTIQLMGALQRKINAKEKQNVGPAGPPVRDTGSTAGRNQPNGAGSR